MVSSLGVASISAVSVTNQPRLFILSCFFALFTVMTSLTAKYVGQNDRKSVNRLLLAGILCTTLASIVISVLSVALATPIMRLCSNQPDTMANSVLYFRILMGGIIANTLYMGINAILRGCGKTIYTFLSNVIFCGVNIFFNYLLIEGHWGFPAWGIGGAAIATVLGTVAALVFCIFVILKPSGYVSLLYSFKQKIRINVAGLREMFEMWQKVVVENLLSRVGFLISGIIAARTGSHNTAVYAVGMHLLNIIFALGNGLQSAAIALVGRSFGANKPADVRSYAQRILNLGLILSVSLSICFLALSKTYYSWMGSDPQFISNGVLSCAFIAVIAPIQSRQLIYNGILKGMGEVKYTMIAAIIAVTFVNTAVVFITIILLHWGVWGIWSGSLVSQSVWLFLLHSRFKKIYLKESLSC
ncbi:MAG: MATE family efflux transporter [Ruthenibacterium sp.]